jgi:hypothetical protein
VKIKAILQPWQLADTSPDQAHMAPCAEEPGISNSSVPIPPVASFVAFLDHA